MYFLNMEVTLNSYVFILNTYVCICTQEISALRGEIPKAAWDFLPPD